MVTAGGDDTVTLEFSSFDGDVLPKAAPAPTTSMTWPETRTTSRQAEAPAGLV
jgi:hypothetical protein